MARAVPRAPDKLPDRAVESFITTSLRRTDQAGNSREAIVVRWWCIWNIRRIRNGDRRKKDFHLVYLRVEVKMLAAAILKLESEA
jgi:hypothetical protein